MIQKQSEARDNDRRDVGAAPDRFDWGEALSPWSRRLAIEAGWRALSRATPWVSVLCGAGLAVAAFGVAGGAGRLAVWIGGGLAVLFIGVAVGVIAWAHAIRETKRRPPGWVAAVLDARRGTRNAVASALEFDVRGPRSAFEALTVAWGRQVLVGLNHTTDNGTRQTGWGTDAASLAHQRRAWLTTALMLVLIGALTGWLWPTAPASRFGTQPLATVEVDRGHGILSESPETESTMASDQTRPRDPQQSVGGGSGDLKPGGEASPGSQPDEQSFAAGSTRASDTSRKPASARNGETLAAAPGPDEPTRDGGDNNRTDQRPDRDPQRSDGARAGAARDGSMTPGSGRMSRSGPERNHDWRVSSTSSAESAATNDAAETLADEAVEPQQQRLGVQPLLRDRNAAPSRQLGISGPKGPPGAGRGGPTPVKRSRGTAAMLVGVPLPELVQSPGQPGAVRTTIEPVQTQPASAWPGEAGEPVGDAAFRAETVWVPTGADGRAATQYLEALREESGDRADTERSTRESDRNAT